MKKTVKATNQPVRNGNCPNLLSIVGVVAIGRNEGERVQTCLRSISENIGAIIYVDSGSEDGSVQRARGMGAEVVELDTNSPFTAARARNAGFERLMIVRPDTRYVQFLDCDCKLAKGWLVYAAHAIESDPELVAVFGRVREAYPERSLFNKLCDLEWNYKFLEDPVAFGGDVMVRAVGVQQVNGYNPSVIAAEDDEFSIRLRSAGWRIRRFDHEMSIHDAAMMHLRQWWKRAERTGYAYAQVGAMHGGPPEHYFEQERRRVLVWGICVPLISMGFLAPSFGLSGLLLGAYPLRAGIIAWRHGRKGWHTRDAVIWAISCVASVFPEAKGLLKYHIDRFRGRRPSIIEYKDFST